MSSSGKAGAPVDMMIPSSIILNYYISNPIVHICNVSDVNWMNDDRGWLGLLRRKKMLHSRHNLVRPGVYGRRKKYIGWIGCSWKRRVTGWR
jgi:hypothetical protein